MKHVPHGFMISCDLCIDTRRHFCCMSWWNVGFRRSNYFSCICWGWIYT